MSHWILIFFPEKLWGPVQLKKIQDIISMIHQLSLQTIQDSVLGTFYFLILLTNTFTKFRKSEVAYVLLIVFMLIAWSAILIGENFF